MRIELGYPNREAERELLVGKNRHSLINTLKTQVTPEQLFEMHQACSKVHASDALLDYLQAIIEYSRESPEYNCGLSPRAGLALLSAAKTWAFMENRDAVLPEDVQTILPAVAAHRLKHGSTNSEAIVAPLLNKVAIP